MIGCMLEVLRITKCMERESLLGLMEDHIVVIISMIKNRDGVFTPGKMEENMTGNGRTGNSMDKESTLTPRGRSKLDNGSLERK